MTVSDSFNVSSGSNCTPLQQPSSNPCQPAQSLPNTLPKPSAHGANANHKREELAAAAKHNSACKWLLKGLAGLIGGTLIVVGAVIAISNLLVKLAIGGSIVSTIGAVTVFGASLIGAMVGAFWPGLTAKDTVYYCMDKALDFSVVIGGIIPNAVALAANTCSKAGTLILLKSELATEKQALEIYQDVRSKWGLLVLNENMPECC
jgi:hypothetical protein